MRSEDGSIIAPGEFLPIAERYGLISEIDRWVIRQAVNLAAQGEATEFNLSGASISDPDIVRELAAAINETGADRGRVDRDHDDEPARRRPAVRRAGHRAWLPAGPRRFRHQVCQPELSQTHPGSASEDRHRVRARRHPQ